MFQGVSRLPGARGNRTRQPRPPSGPRRAAAASAVQQPGVPTAERRAPSGRPTRVLLVCNYTLIRAALRSLLDRAPGVAVAGEAGDIQEAIQWLAAHSADVLILDLAVFGFDGLKTLTQAGRPASGPRIVALATQATLAQADQIRAAGATGLVLRYSPPGELLQAIHAAARGRAYRSGLIIQGAAAGSPPGRGLKDPMGGMTARQRDVLQQLAGSKTTKEIALTLGLSAKTVEFHRAQVMRRLGISDVPGLVRFALRAGLVPL